MNIFEVEILTDDNGRDTKELIIVANDVEKAIELVRVGWPLADVKKVAMVNKIDAIQEAA